VGRASVEAVSKAVKVVSEDLAALGEAVVTEVWRQTRRSRRMWHGPSGGWRGTSGGPSRWSGRQSKGISCGPNGGQRGNDSASMEAVEDRAHGWRGNDSSQG
jgi:hypothetical protein